MTMNLIMSNLLNYIKIISNILFFGTLLIPILVFNINKGPYKVFNLCVNYLEFVAQRCNITYIEINVYIFCILWPIITLLSIIF